jgi:hypothetical protein
MQAVADALSLLTTSRRPEPPIPGSCPHSGQQGVHPTLVPLGAI